MRPLLTLVTIFTASVAVSGEWKRLPSLPDKEGFAGSFAGLSGDALIVAGGTNFPNKKPWEGGKKVWYDNVFVLDKFDGQWKVAGKLPRPLGYGVCVTHDTGVVCVGGADVDRHYADAFRLEWKKGTLVTTKIPSLPRPVANACGALVGNTLYVAGGQEMPTATDTLNTVYRMDLSAAEMKWQEIDACPGGGRMLAVAAGFKGAFWLVGGVKLVVGKGEKVERRYLNDAYRYDPDTGWKRIADLPHAVAAAPTPAPADATGFYLLGGDDGSQVGVSPDRHRGFATTILRFDAQTEIWPECGELSAARVTVPCVVWGQSWVIPGGEARPGVRSPQVWSSVRPKKRE